jgi:hypothetical protein
MSQTPPKAGGGWPRTLIVGIACLIVGTICGSALASSSKTHAPSTTSNNAVAATAEPVRSTPTPRQVISLNEQGSKVQPVTLEDGSYRVDWTAQGGQDNFILIIHGASNSSQHLVNEVPPNPSSGQTLFQSSGGGTYTLEIKASTLSWAITFTPI